MTHPLLTAKGVSKHFGGLRAVDGVSFDVFRGEILGILGPNGAGKTVLFNLISGIYEPSSGEIWFSGERIDSIPPHLIAQKGIGRTFQIVKPFASLTVLQNVLVARGITRYSHLFKVWGSWGSKAEIRKAMEVLEKVGLSDLAERKAGLLPLGNLRRLEIARALVVGHSVLLLDESFSGLRHDEILRLEDLIRSIRKDGLTVILIEHNMRVSMGLCDRIIVLDHGQKIAEGPPVEIQQDKRVIEAYLGEKELPMLLEVDNIHVSYSDIQAVCGVSFHLEKGELISIIGANGAGKSTILNAVMGIFPPQQGKITFKDQDITAMPSHQRARIGIRMVPERARVFPRLTVYENLLAGMYGLRDKLPVEERISSMYKVFPILEERKSQLANTLSGGEQQQLSIARALVSNPELLLVDEVSMGLMPKLVEQVFGILEQLNKEQGLTILLVEQNAVASLAISSRGYVLETGTCALQGSAQELMDNPKVKEVYLGH